MDSIKGNKLAILGLIGLVLIFILAFIGPLLSDHDYAEQDVTRKKFPLRYQYWIRYLSFRLMEQAQMEQTHIKTQELKKISGLVLTN